MTADDVKAARMRAWRKRRRRQATEQAAASRAAALEDEVVQWEVEATQTQTRRQRLSGISRAASDATDAASAACAALDDLARRNRQLQLWQRRTEQQRVEKEEKEESSDAAEQRQPLHNITAAASSAANVHSSPSSPVVISASFAGVLQPAARVTVQQRKKEMKLRIGAEMAEMERREEARREMQDEMVKVALATLSGVMQLLPKLERVLGHLDQSQHKSQLQKAHEEEKSAE